MAKPPRSDTRPRLATLGLTLLAAVAGLFPAALAGQDSGSCTEAMVKECKDDPCDARCLPCRGDPRVQQCALGNTGAGVTGGSLFCREQPADPLCRPAVGPSGGILPEPTAEGGPDGEGIKLLALSSLSGLRSAVLELSFAGRQIPGRILGTPRSSGTVDLGQPSYFMGTSDINGDGLPDLLAGPIHFEGLDALRVDLKVALRGPDGFVEGPLVLSFGAHRQAWGSAAAPVEAWQVDLLILRGEEGRVLFQTGNLPVSLGFSWPGVEYLSVLTRQESELVLAESLIWRRREIYGTALASASLGKDSSQGNLTWSNITAEGIRSSGAVDVTASAKTLRRAEQLFTGRSGTMGQMADVLLLVDGKDRQMTVVRPDKKGRLKPKRMDAIKPDLSWTGFDGSALLDRVVWDAIADAIPR